MCSSVRDGVKARGCTCSLVCRTVVQVFDDLLGARGNLFAFEVVVDVGVANAEGELVGEQRAVIFEVGGGDFFK